MKWIAALAPMVQFSQSTPVRSEPLSNRQWTCWLLLVWCSEFGVAIVGNFHFEVDQNGGTFSWCVVGARCFLFSQPLPLWMSVTTWCLMLKIRIQWRNCIYIIIITHLPTIEVAPPVIAVSQSITNQIYSIARGKLRKMTNIPPYTLRGPYHRKCVKDLQRDITRPLKASWLVALEAVFGYEESWSLLLQECETWLIDIQVAWPTVNPSFCHYLKIYTSLPFIAKYASVLHITLYWAYSCCD